MKKTTLLFILFLTGLMACSTPEDKPKQQSNAAPAFQLFPTTNMWTFIKLDTRFTLYSTKNMYTFILLDQHDGRMWQVQWAIDADQRLVIPINPTQNSTNL